MAKKKKVVIIGKGNVILKKTLWIPEDEVEEFVQDESSLINCLEDDDMVRIEDVDLTSVKVNGEEVGCF